MTHGRPPRRPRWQATPDTMVLAKSRASKPPAADVAAIVDALKGCFESLRTGNVTKDQFSVLTGAVITARAIELQRVVKGLADIIHQGDQALDAVWHRLTRDGTFGSTSLYSPELEAIREFVGWHCWQINQLSRAEYLRAVASACGRIGPTGLVLNSPQQMKALTA